MFKSDYIRIGDEVPEANTIWQGNPARAVRRGVPQMVIAGDRTMASAETQPRLAMKSAA